MHVPLHLSRDGLHHEVPIHEGALGLVHLANEVVDLIRRKLTLREDQRPKALRGEVLHVPLGHLDAHRRRREPLQHDVVCALRVQHRRVAGFAEIVAVLAGVLHVRQLAACHWVEGRRGGLVALHHPYSRIRSRSLVLVVEGRGSFDALNEHRHALPLGTKLVDNEHLVVLVLAPDIDGQPARHLPPKEIPVVSSSGHERLLVGR
mmetsp:Transcript_29332/g.84311  ORF Transcript_29332/g.84311 Transcript_29332/m.84311 type:complete len:205 (+) Transcript_29332:3967-4581(+)